MGIKITKPGQLTTIQDAGRHGYRKHGLIVSGAMDTVAYRIANLLVGNHENEAAIETTLAGPEIYFEEHHIIAITGADHSPQINGQDIKSWSPVYVKKGSTLSFGKPLKGCRSYISIAGGLDIPLVMNSASTYLRAGIGGWKGRALQQGDFIPTKELSNKEGLSRRILGKPAPAELAFFQARWAPSPFLLPKYTHSPTIRVIPGLEWEWFTHKGQAKLWVEEFRITPQSDRMGLRLEGPTLQLKEKRELLSTAVTFGTVQVPAGGAPIILMADHPTTGGYPRIAQVIKADLPQLAQVRPGEKLKFTKVGLQEAQQLYFQQERHIALLKKALYIKTRTGEYG